MSDDIYDYIIVGAGTAGCVIAERLSRNHTTRVLLIEAGPPGISDLSTTPHRWPELTGTDRDHSLYTTPQTGLGERVLSWPRGAGLGGSGQINAMVQVLGAPEDVKQWESDGLWAAGDFGDELIRAERPTIADSVISVVGKYDSPHPYTRAFLTAAERAGHRRTDYFIFAEPGVGLYRTTISDDAIPARRSTFTDYLHPAMSRSNLTIHCDTRAHHLVFDGRACVGITASRPHGDISYTARREVVLCAGTVASAELLLRTRYEQPAGVLDNLAGIGTNLRDHVQVSLSYPTDESIPVSGGSNLGEAGGFVRLDLDESSAAPEVQLSFAPMLGVNESHSVGGGFTIAPAITRPRSVGSVTLSADGSHALIDPRYLTSDYDAEILRRGVRVAMSIADQPPLSSLSVGADSDPDPQDDEAVDAFIRANAQTQYHPVGTCRAGMPDDPNAVVDTRFRVFGTTGLRIADASVIPTVPTGNINSVVVAVARLAANALTESDGKGE